MDGVGHGTELAGRYRLEERLRTTAASDFWRAVDTTLDRTVGIRLVAPETAEGAMDAARRAAVVDAPALLRVLDVAQEPGDTGPVTYVVTEFVEADSLADLLRRHGALPADQVRSLVGRTAQVLATAAESGLHHEALEPTSVLRTPGGEVKLEGLGVDAAAEGRAGAPGDRAARTDAVALVALVYAGLTGHWPLDGEVAGLDPAPRIGGVPVPPGDIVDDVPNDLDTLCVVTFGPVDDGPRSPAEVVENLRPWASGATPAGAPQAGSAAAGAAGAGAAGAAAGAARAAGTDEPTRAMSFAKPGDGAGPAGAAPAAGAGPAHDGPQDPPAGSSMRPAGRFPRSGAAGPDAGPGAGAGPAAAGAAAAGAAVAAGAGAAAGAAAGAGRSTPETEQEQTAAVPRAALFDDEPAPGDGPTRAVPAVHDPRDRDPGCRRRVRRRGVRRRVRRRVPLRRRRRGLRRVRGRAGGPTGGR